MNQRWLAQRYNTFNRLYWKGRLPRDTIVQWGNLPRTIEARTYYLPDSVAVIIIEGTLHFYKCYAEMTLLHEMAHIATKGNRHGKKWQAEMHRLVKLKAFDNLW